MRAGGLVAALLLLCAGVAGGEPSKPAADARIVLLIEAPQKLDRHAERLERWEPERLASFTDLLGLATDSRGAIPIRVVLAPVDSSAELGAPAWVAGYARGESSVVVLFPERVPVYPYRSIEELLGHEVAHILIHRASAGQPLPRWFHEGLAMLAEEAWGLEDRSRVALAVLRRGRHQLADLDRRFQDPRQVPHAYALSGAFVRDLVNRYGRSFPAAVLRSVAAGGEFGQAFENATGVGLAAAEDSFWRRFTFWYRWLPFLTSSTVLWIGIALLALIAVRGRRRRTRALREKWDREERLSAELRRLTEPSDAFGGEEPDEPVN